MVFWRLQREVFLLVASSTIVIAVFILACCYRVEKKWMQESNEHEKNNRKSAITEDSEDGPPVQVCQDAISKANINEGSDTFDVVDTDLAEDSGKKISVAENGNCDAQVLNQPYNNEDGILGLTRLNHDGSMDTRF